MLIFLCFIRISNHQEAAEARRREGIQRREAIVKNKILREFALDQSKSKKEALLELRSEMGEALHQTKERLNVLYFQPTAPVIQFIVYIGQEEVTRLQVCNKYSSEDVALAVREVAHRFLLPLYVSTPSSH